MLYSVSGGTICPIKFIGIWEYAHFYEVTIRKSSTSLPGMLSIPPWRLSEHYLDCKAMDNNLRQIMILFAFYLPIFSFRWDDLSIEPRFLDSVLGHILCACTSYTNYRYLILAGKKSKSFILYRLLAHVGYFDYVGSLDGEGEGGWWNEICLGKSELDFIAPTILKNIDVIKYLYLRQKPSHSNTQQQNKIKENSISRL